MSRFAQFRSVLSDRPLEGLLYLLGALYILVVLCFGFGLPGIPLAIVAIGICGRYFLLNVRRYPRFKLADIGTIEMDLATRSTGDLSPRLLMGTFILLGAMWTLTVVAEGAKIVVSHFRDVGDVPRLDQFAQHLLLAVFGTTMVYFAYRNNWRRMLITNRGLYQVLDVTRPWPTDRPLDEPQSPLRAMQIYCWDQVARYHWSKLRGEHVLHLNVRQPWIPVPQLLSYRLPTLSDEGRQRLDQLLQQHVVEAAGAESEGALATSGIRLVHPGRRAMSRFAQIRSAITDWPLDWVGYFLVAAYAALLFHSGLPGTLVAFVVIASIGRFVVPRCFARLVPGCELSKIGPIEMEIAAPPAALLPRKLFFGAFILYLIVFLILLGHVALTIVESHFQDLGENSDLQTLIMLVCVLAGNTRSMYLSYRNRWRRFLITEQGLFDIIAPKRPWLTDRPLNEPDSPLRARRIYSWDQVARFHWGRQSGEPVLHLSVHQHGFGVPQLVSLPLRALAEQDWQKLNQLLRTHVLETGSDEPGRALTTSAALSAGHVA